MDFPCTWWGQCKSVAWIIDSSRGQTPIPALRKSTAFTSLGAVWIHQDLAPKSHAENEKQEVLHQWGGGEEPCPHPLPSSHTYHASPHPYTQPFGCGARATPASHQPFPHDCAGKLHDCVSLQGGQEESIQLIHILFLFPVLLPLLSSWSVL